MPQIQESPVILSIDIIIITLDYRVKYTPKDFLSDFKKFTKLNSYFSIGSLYKTSDIFCFVFVHFSCHGIILKSVPKIRFALYF